MTNGNSARAAGGELRTFPFRVGEWLVEPDWNRVRRGDEIVKLEPRVMRLLTALAAAPHRPLQRQDLLDTVWPDTLVNEEALSRAISQLRRALGDDPKAPRYLQTVHKGYCLIAPVSDDAQSAGQQFRVSAGKTDRRLVWMLLLVVIAGLGGVIVYINSSRSPQPPESRALVPLTSEPGREIDPAVSPDGSRVAYLASNGNGAGYQIFVRPITGGDPVQLTANGLAKGHPTWSPARDRLAFVGAHGGSAAIYILSIKKNGEARKLIDLPSWSFGLDWSPDGTTLAYSDAAAGEAASIVLLDIATKAARPIAPDASSAGDAKPVFSPDGKRLAFLRSDPLGRQRIVVADIGGDGKTEMLAAPTQSLRGLDWTPNGQSLLFSARAGRRFLLWRVAADGNSAPEVLRTEGGDLFNPSVARDGRVVLEEVEQDSDVWRADLANTSAAPLIRSTSDDYGPAYAPDGRSIAFISQRSGTSEIWVQPAGARARRLTSLSGPDIRQITWSSEGERLAFVAEEPGETTIYAVGTAGGEPLPLLRNAGSKLPIGWSAGGDALFILTPKGANWGLERLDLSRGTRRSEFPSPLRLAAVAADGRSVFAVPAGENKLLQIAPARGVVRQFRLPPFARVESLLPSANAIYFIDNVLGTGVVYRLNLTSGVVSRIIRLDDYGGVSSTTSNGRFLAYTRATETANDLAWTQL